MTDYNNGEIWGWNGGECPVHPESMVEVWLRNGSVRETVAGDMFWRHAGIAEIIAFRVVKADSCQRVTVKPLVWFEVERGTNGYGKWTAQGYTVRKIEGLFLLDFAGDSKSTWRFMTSDAAKAATQADYEARILAAIDTQPDPQCCMCGKLGLSTAEDGGPECELHDGRWVCSSECWNNASALAETTPPQPDPRDAVIAAVDETWSAYKAIKAIQSIPTIDPSAIREAALREAVKGLRDWQDNLILQRYPDTALTVGMAADVVEALIGEKK